MDVRRSTTERLLPLSFLLFGLLLPACSTETVPTDPLEPAVSAGGILGLVTGDGTPLSGVTITLSRGGLEIATATTAENGEFGFPGLEAGTYVVAIPEIAGMNCSRQLAATVVGGQEAAVSFACVTPPAPARVGMVEGRVTVNGVAARRILVTVVDTRRLYGGRTTTDDGAYRFTNIPVGPKSVWLYTQGTCTGTHQQEVPGSGLLRTQLEVIVPEEGVAVANFACTGQVITGTVTVNGAVASGMKVRVCLGLPVWDYGCLSDNQVTDSEGRYVYTSLPDPWGLLPGDYVVFVSPPSGTTCPEPLGVSVRSGAVVTVDIACAAWNGDPGQQEDPGVGQGFWDY